MLNENVVEVESQQRALIKQAKYLGSVSKRHQLGYHSSSDLEETIEKSWIEAEQDYDAEATDDYQLSSAEYADLITKASQMENYQIQLDNAQALLAEHVKEIQVLKEAIEAMSGQLGASTPNSDNQGLRLLQKQVDELKKVWAHELDANMILRNLITKSQAEYLAAEQESRRGHATLREDFDELTAVLEDTDKEVGILRETVAHKDRMLAEVALQLEERQKEQLETLDGQHQELMKQVQELHSQQLGELRLSLQKVENDRDRLLEEIKHIKASFTEKLGQALKSAEELAKKFSEVEKSREEYRKEKLDIADSLARLHEEYQRERTNLSDSLAKLQSESDNEKLALKKRIEQLQSENEQLCNSSEEALKQLDQLQGDRDQALRDFQTTQEDYTMLQLQVQVKMAHEAELMAKLTQYESQAKLAKATEDLQVEQISLLDGLTQDLKSQLQVMEQQWKDSENVVRSLEIQLQQKNALLSSTNKASTPRSGNGFLDEVRRLEKLLAQKETELLEERKLSRRRIPSQANDEMAVSTKVEQAALLSKQQREQLERAVQLRDKKIDELEAQLQDVLRNRHEFMPLNDMRNREAKMNKSLQTKIDEIREIATKLKMCEEVFRCYSAEHYI
jgi:hypothetical protein